MRLWHLADTETHRFFITVTPQVPGPSWPLLILLVSFMINLGEAKVFLLKAKPKSVSTGRSLSLSAAAAFRCGVGKTDLLCFSRARMLKD